MGYTELAKRGHKAHQLYINTAPPSGQKRDSKPHSSARLEVVLSREFWEEERNRRRWKDAFHVRNNRMGHWIVGRLFKVLYSYARMRKLIRDADKVRRADQIILRRYVDPLASGG